MRRADAWVLRLLFGLCLAAPALASAEEPPQPEFYGQSSNLGVEVVVAYAEGDELKDAVPGGQLDLTVTLRALSPIVLTLVGAGSPLAEGGAAFKPDAIGRPRDRFLADGFHTRTYDVAVLVTDVAPRKHLLRFDFGAGRDTIFRIPVGAKRQTLPTDPTYVTVTPPAQMTVNAFERNNGIEFIVNNNFTNYDIEVLGYTIENSEGVFVKREATRERGQGFVKVRHNDTQPLPIAIAPNDWKALVTPDSAPTMDVRISYTDGYRTTSLRCPALPFRVRYGPSLTLVCCLVGSVLGAVFRTVASKKPETPPASRLGAGASRALLSVVAGALGWLLSRNYGVELSAKGVALVTADTPVGSLFVGILMGLIPPSRYGGWIYEKLTGQKLPEA